MYIYCKNDTRTFQCQCHKTFEKLLHYKCNRFTSTFFILILFLGLKQQINNLEYCKFLIPKCPAKQSFLIWPLLQEQVHQLIFTTKTNQRIWIPIFTFHVSHSFQYVFFQVRYIMTMSTARTMSVEHETNLNCKCNDSDGETEVSSTPPKKKLSTCDSVHQKIQELRTRCTDMPMTASLCDALALVTHYT